MIVIDCPIPPSLNRLWRKARAGHIYKNPKVAAWEKEFWHAIFLLSARGRPAMITGPFDAEILIYSKRRRDADNNAKALLDACEHLGIISNDRNARRVIQEIVSKDRAPLGCRLTITPL